MNINNLEMNPYLKTYLNGNIKPFYEKNDKGHDFNHIENTLYYALLINEEYKLPIDIIVVTVYYHDVACWLSRNEHEYLSKIIVQNDFTLHKYFSSKDIQLIATAVGEHRTKSNKTTLLSKILSDADKADACRIDRMIYRAWYYGKKYHKDVNNVNELIEKCHKTQYNRYFNKDTRYKFNLEISNKIVKPDLDFSLKILSDYDNLFLPYAKNMIKQNILL